MGRGEEERGERRASSSSTRQRFQGTSHVNMVPTLPASPFPPLFPAPLISLLLQPLPSIFSDRRKDTMGGVRTRLRRWIDSIVEGYRTSSSYGEGTQYCTSPLSPLPFPLSLTLLSLLCFPLFVLPLSDANLFLVPQVLQK